MTHNTEKKMKRGKQEKYAVLSIADMKAMIKMAESGLMYNSELADINTLVVYFEAAGPRVPGQLKFTEAFDGEYSIHRFPEHYQEDEEE